MDDAAIGRSIRAVRIRRHLRQADVAAAAGVTQQTLSRIERGRLEGMTLGLLRRVTSELGMRLTIEARWEGAELDRLLGGRHSAMHEALARVFSAPPTGPPCPRSRSRSSASAARSTSSRGMRRRGACS